MPDASKFTTLGFFPFCLSKVNVSSYDYWQTLGGTRKGSSPSESQLAAEINLSLKNAMKLFWNTSELTGEASAIGGGVSVILTSSGEVTTEPEDRECWQSYPLQWDFDNDAVMGMRMKPYRMYDGATSDESNFVGYGVSGSFASSTADAANVDVHIGSASILTGFYDEEESAYVTVSGIPMVCDAYADSWFGDPVTLNAAGLSASGSQGGTDYLASIDSDGIKFYSYT
jgi:hypothetical protein